MYRPGLLPGVDGVHRDGPAVEIGTVDTVDEDGDDVVELRIDVLVVFLGGEHEFDRNRRMRRGQVELEDRRILRPVRRDQRVERAVAGRTQHP